MKIIPKDCFRDCRSLDHVSFGRKPYITRICDNGFRCSNMKHLIWPSTVVYIPQNCFDGCEYLVSIDFGSDSKVMMTTLSTFQYFFGKSNGSGWFRSVFCRTKFGDSWFRRSFVHFERSNKA